MRYPSTENSNQLSEKYGRYIFLAAILLAVFLRFYDLTDKPLHTDEAVNALKFKSLLEDGNYKYDPSEYHGPSLYYLTLIPSLLRSEKTLADTDELTLRSVTAAGGILLILFIFLMRKEAGFEFVFFAALITIISPIVNYYSRYYIHETLLVSFTFCGLISLYLYASNFKLNWIILAGFFLGLAFATKETFIIRLSALVLSAIIVRLFRVNSTKNIKINYLHWSGFAATFLLVSITLFTSFFSNPQGIIDAITTFTNYFTKAGNNAEHIQPWYYYFSLVFYNALNGAVLSEFILVVFAIPGIIFSIRNRNGSLFHLIMLFLSFFTIIVTIVYSVVPYKTPWLMLTFWQGIIFLAAYGLMQLLKTIKGKLFKTLFIVFITMVFAHLSVQIYLTSYKYPSNTANPYTYSQPQSDLVNAIRTIEKITGPLEKGSEVYMSVTAPGHEYWPLPWYLRKYRHVAWSDTIRHDIYQFPIILVTPDYESELVKYLYEIPPPGKRDLYIPLFTDKVELRPNLELHGYIKKDLYDTYLYDSAQNSNQTE